MNHPSREDWMSFLYDEVEAQQRTELESHLNNCAECQADVAVWRRTSAALDDWKLPERKRPAFTWSAVPRWGIAALLMLSLGFVGGRFGGASGTETGALRDELRQLREQTETQARAAAAQQVSGLADSLNTRFLTLETQQAKDYATLRQELETVALFTEAGFQRAQRQFVHLAGYQPENPTQ